MNGSLSDVMRKPNREQNTEINELEINLNRTGGIESKVPRVGVTRETKREAAAARLGREAREGLAKRRGR